MELPLVAGLCRFPVFVDDALDSPHAFVFGDAGVGHPVQFLFSQVELFAWRQMPIVGNSSIVFMRDEIEDVLFEIGLRAEDMACTLSLRIISARERPNSAVLMAPASVTIIFPPFSMCRL